MCIFSVGDSPRYARKLIIKQTIYGHVTVCTKSHVPPWGWGQLDECNDTQSGYYPSQLWPTRYIMPQLTENMPSLTQDWHEIGRWRTIIPP